MNSQPRKLETFCVVAFVIVNLVAPLVIGEVFPFTISPMFSDQPAEYCVYRVLDQNGQLIDGEPFGLHLIYDGNPPGLGMGIQAQPTLHGFGETVTLEQLRSHVEAKLVDMPECECVTVERCLVRCVSNRPVESVTSIQVFRDGVANRDSQVSPDKNLD